MTCKTIINSIKKSDKYNADHLSSEICQKIVLYDLFKNLDMCNTEFLQNLNDKFILISTAMKELFNKDFKPNSIKNQYYEWKRDPKRYHKKLFSRILDQNSLNSLMLQLQNNEQQQNMQMSSNENEIISLRNEAQETDTFSMNNQIQNENYILETKVNYLQRTISNLQADIFKLRNINQMHPTIDMFDDISTLEEENRYLKNLNSMLLDKKICLENKNSKLKERLRKNQRNILIFDNLEANLDKSIFLLTHLSFLEGNQPHNHGNRWNKIKPTYKTDKIKCDPSELHLYMYSIISFLPEYWFNILQVMFHLPSLNTCKSMRKKLMKKTMLPFCNENIDEGFLKNYIEICWGPLNKMDDKRYLLVIDAAALSVNGGFNKKSGETIGYVDNIHKNYDNLNECLADNHKLAKAVFVIMLCPLDPLFRPLIIYRKYVESGAATVNEINALKTIRTNLNSLGLQYIGTASDGDRTFYSFSSQFANSIFCNDDFIIHYLAHPLHELFSYYNQEPWFQDVLHLLKCDRYTIIAGKQIRILPNYEDLFVTLKDFKTFFPNVSNNVFNKKQYTKMVDSLVFELFDWPTVQKAMIENDLLIPILLPPALLLQVFYNPNIDRNDRYHYLNMGTAIIFIHAYSWRVYCVNSKSDDSFPVNKETIIKYLFLAVSLARLFNDPKSFDLADCTSHLLEHFFGLIRRLCQGNNSKERFESSLLKATCLQAWLTQLNLNVKIPERKNPDSSAIVEKGRLSKIMQERKFEVYVKSACQLFRNIFQNHGHNFDLVFPFCKYLDTIECDLIEFDPKKIKINCVSKEHNTMIQRNYIVTGGYCNMNQHSSAFQADHLNSSE